MIPYIEKAKKDEKIIWPNNTDELQIGLLTALKSQNASAKEISKYGFTIKNWPSDIVKSRELQLALLSALDSEGASIYEINKHNITIPMDGVKRPLITKRDKRGGSCKRKRKTRKGKKYSRRR